MQASGLILIVIMIAVALVLIVGVVLMAKGGETNRKHSTKLMITRVVLQALALGLVGLLFLLSGK